MVRLYNCSFCGYEIEPGTGSTFIRKDGAVLRFCTTKCRKSSVVYKRDARKLKWTKFYERKIKDEKTEKAEKAKKVEKTKKTKKAEKAE